LRHVPLPFCAFAPTSLRRRLTPLIIVTAALAGTPAQAQAPAGAAGPPTSGAKQLVGDVRAYVTAPLHAERAQWVRFGAVLGAIAVAYRYDDDMRSHFGSTTVGATGSPDTRDSHDAIPAALAVGGTWLSAVLLDDDDGRREAGSMLEAAALSGAAAYVLKQAAGRQRPYVAGDSTLWHSGDDSFPSLHVTAAFAIGTVLAESGNDRYRWIRRVLGYTIAAGTAYQRMNHDAHWFSDTVAGAGLGIATARFVIKRREHSDRRAEIGLAPISDGFALTYSIPLRH
jgi:membrane-associated phospholipid phosphatase